jgi:hypothetical protein
LELAPKISGIGGREVSLIFEGLEDGFLRTENFFFSLGAGMGICWSSQIPQNTGFSHWGWELGDCWRCSYNIDFYRD